MAEMKYTTGNRKSYRRYSSSECDELLLVSKEINESNLTNEINNFAYVFYELTLQGGKLLMRKLLSSDQLRFSSQNDNQLFPRSFSYSSSYSDMLKYHFVARET